MRKHAARPAVGKKLTLAAAALLALVVGCGPDRPDAALGVDVGTLASRCHPKGGGGQQAFRDLLALRDEPRAAAIPALVQVLRDHAGLDRIHRFAAAQALSTIDADEARKALEAEVSRADFDGRLAFDYAFHWNMAPDARDAFLVRYVLHTAGEAPSLALRHVTDAQAPLDALTFDVVVTNATSAAQVLMNPADRGPEMLVFRAVEGHVARTRWPGTCEFLGARAVSFAPGESSTVRVVVEVKLAGPDLKPWGQAEGQVVGAASGYWYLLEGPGEYEVIARWTSPHGRSVSAPVRVLVPQLE